MRTLIHSQSHAASVLVSITRTSGTTLRVTATAGDQSSEATLTGAHGKPIKLAYVRYLCYMPPTPGFCAGAQATSSPSEYMLKFHVPAHIPVDVLASVESPNGPTGIAAPRGTTKAPPFKVSQTVRAESPGKGVSSYASSVAAQHGATADLLTEFTAPASAAPQTVKLSLDRGPASSLHATATVPGGAPSHATITSAGGGPISLVFPRYVCYAPPAATFCPPPHVTTGPQTYSAQFPAIPGVPIALLASIGR
jgi:hypothetical protein